MAAGIYRDVAEAAAVVEVGPEATVPDTGRRDLYQHRLQLYRSLYRSTKELMRALDDS